MPLIRFIFQKCRKIFFQAYVILILAGVSIGTMEYARFWRSAKETGGGEIKQEETQKEEKRQTETENVSKTEKKADFAEELPPKLALTFDDGPHPVYTVQLLDGLRERGVKATFFLIGKNIQGREDIVRQMEEDGHLIGNHTWSHVKLTDLDALEACQEITKTSELVKSITGKNTEFIRPPFGSWDDTLECGFDMFPVLWSVDPLDWTTSNVDQVVQKVVSEVEENDIILLHDCYDSSVEAALRIVDLLQAEGYEFVTADKMILE